MEILVQISVLYSK